MSNSTVAKILLGLACVVVGWLLMPRIRITLPKWPTPKPLSEYAVNVVTNVTNKLEDTAAEHLRQADPSLAANASSSSGDVVPRGFALQQSFDANAPQTLTSDSVADLIERSTRPGTDTGNVDRLVLKAFLEISPGIDAVGADTFRAESSEYAKKYVEWAAAQIAAGRVVRIQPAVLGGNLTVSLSPLFYANAHDADRVKLFEIYRALRALRSAADSWQPSTNDVPLTSAPVEDINLNDGNKDSVHAQALRISSDSALMRDAAYRATLRFHELDAERTRQQQLTEKSP